MKIQLEEPLAHSLISITKKYLSVFTHQTQGMELDRYQYLLMLIDDNDERLTQKALAELLQVDKSYMVNMLDYLSERGYIIREKNLNDRRQQLIKLTPKARLDIPRIRKVITELNRQSLQNLTEGQVKTFNQVLETIQENLSHSFEIGFFLDYKKVAIK